MRRLLKRQAGLTLVELLVATTLSLILMAGVLLVFSANKSTYQMQNGLGTLQENGRYALRQITSDLQLAGYGGCLSPHLQPKPRVINLVDNPPAYLDEFADGVFVAGEDNDTGDTQYGDDARAMYEGPDGAGTDSIEIRGPLRSNAHYVAGSVPASGDIEVKGSLEITEAEEPYFLVSDCAGADIFYASDVSAAGDNTAVEHANGNTQNDLSRSFSADAVVTEIARHTYFVADTGRTNALSQPITALYRFDGIAGHDSVELVDGIEDLQVDYALDSNGDGRIDIFKDDLGAAEWSEVLAIRVRLLVNSVEPASAVPAPYTYFPASSVQLAPPDGDRRLRQEFSSLVYVRNAM